MYFSATIQEWLKPLEMTQEKLQEQQENWMGKNFKINSG